MKRRSFLGLLASLFAAPKAEALKVLARETPVEKALPPLPPVQSPVFVGYSFVVPGSFVPLNVTSGCFTVPSGTLGTGILQTASCANQGMAIYSQSSEIP